MDYLLGEVLYAGTQTRVVRATHAKSAAAVVLKMPVGEVPSPRTLERLQHEHAVLCSLRVPGVIATKGLEAHSQGLMLVLEPWGEGSLDRVLARGPLPIVDALRLGAATARALWEVHRRGIIHRDIKPQNILIDEGRRQVRLVDFGIATRWTQKVQATEAVEALSGTLVYMAPEQTGRMNRTVDTRADLYALGVTLYEMLTGALPFTAQDALSLIHAHITRPPTAPHERAPGRGVPEAVSAIVLKLMEKSPDARYQTAAGAAFDLERAAQALTEAGEVAPFELGTRDWEDRIRKPSRLFDREQESEALAAAFERAASGGVGMALVTGPSGVGKSALVQALRERARERHGIFAPGKFDQLKRSTPYAAIAQALRTVVRRRLADPAAELEAWRQAWLEAAGPNGRILVELMPELAHILGETRPLVELGPVEARLRFQSTVQRFVRTIGTAEHPLVLFIDDLQWADPASLSLLRELLVEARGHHLLLVGAYRNDEVGPGHPLLELFEAAQAKGAAVPTITLAPLRAEAVTQLVADMLDRPAHEVAELGQIVKEKTDGSPFFIGQFLQLLHEQGLLSRDPATGQWQWQRGAIERAGITDNVVTLLTQRLGELSPELKRVLQTAACIGDRFEPELVAHLTGQSPEQVSAALAVAVGEGVLSHEGEAGHEVYAFAHDRVQQATYEARSPEERLAAHLSIGRKLRARYGVKCSDDELFATLYHRNRAASLVSAWEEKRDLAEQNLRAGQRAKASGAFTEAAGFLEVAQRLLEDTGAAFAQALTLEVNMTLAQALTLSGRTGEGDALFSRCIERAPDEVERAWVASMWLPLFVGTVRVEQGVELGLDAMGWLGHPLPRTLEEQATWQEQTLEALAPILERMTDEDWRALPVSEDRVHRLTCKILDELAGCALVRHPTLTVGCRMRIVTETLRHGITENTFGGGSTTACIMAFRLGKMAAARRLIESMLALSERFDVSRWVTLVSAANLSAYFSPLSRAVEAYRHMVRVGAEESNAYAIFGVVLASCIEALLGVYLPRVVRSLSERTIQNPLAAAWQKILLGALTLLRQSTSAGAIDLPRELEALLEPARGSAISSLYAGGIASFAGLHLGMDAWAARTALATEASWRAASGSGGALMFVISLCVAGAHSLSAVPDEERRALLEKLDLYGGRLALWAESCAENFLHFHRMMEAGRARHAGWHEEAERLYVEAIEHAHKHGRAHDEALALRLSGEHHRERGRARLASMHLTAAYNGYLRWGARAAAERIRALYPDHVLAVEAAAAAPGEPPKRAATEVTETTTTSEDVGLNARLDVGSALRVAQSLSSDRALGSLVGRVLHLLAENAGAERAVLALSQGGELRVTAELTVSPERIELDLHEPVEGSKRLPATLLRYVERGKEALVLAEALGDSRFSEDPYLLERKPASVFAVPLLHQQRLSGVLYLEHARAANAFPQARVELLTMLASQAATAVENATLYAELSAYNERLEREVAQRTAELKVAKDAADAASRAKSDFLSSMSHELRTPLNGILGCSQVLERMPDLPAKGRVSARVIHRSGEHLLRLINDVLDLAKIEAGKLDIVPAEVDFPSVLSTVASICRVRAEQKDVAFACEQTGPELSRVRTDEKRLVQVLLNLIGNAIKFTDRGKVTLRTEVSEERDADGRAVRFVVEDTGVGIAAEHLSKIFEPFEQVGSVKARAEGTGLGLAITRRIVEQMGGSLEVQSEVGQGSTFRVTLRLPEVEAEGARAIATPQGLITGYEGERRTILVVDDIAENRMLIRELLAPLGFGVVEVDSGTAALGAVAEERPDLILMDVGMQGMDGNEATRRLRQMPGLDKTRIVASSAGVSAAMQAASLEAGCDGVLPKPVSFEALLATLEHHLGLRWVRGASFGGLSASAPLEEEGPGAGCIPPEALRAMLALVERGRQRQLLEMTTRLGQEAPELQGEIGRVRALAEQFQMKKLRELLQAQIRARGAEAP